MSENTTTGVKENNWVVTTSSWEVDLIFFGQVIAVFRFQETAFQVLSVTCIVQLQLKGQIASAFTSNQLHYDQIHYLL